MVQLIIILITTFFTTPTLNSTFVSDCDVKALYEAIDTDYGVKVITSLGSIEDVDVILSPIKMDVGDYKVNVTRKANNIYKVEGTDYYLETNFCYEYSYSDEAILSIESQYGYTKGKLFFK